MYPGICDGDLRTALWGPRSLGVRRLKALLYNLPPDSAVWRVLYTDGKQWGTLEELLSTLAELTDHTNRLLYQAHGGKDTWDPLRIPRPSDKKKAPPSTHDEVRDFFQGASGNVVVLPDDVA